MKCKLIFKYKQKDTQLYLGLSKIFVEGKFIIF